MASLVVQGKPKKNESLWGVACGVFRMLRKNYGCVRVDFTQPFSLKVRAERDAHSPSLLWATHCSLTLPANQCHTHGLSITHILLLFNYTTSLL